MGKIYDALKRAEKEAKINRENQQSLNNKETITSREPSSEAKKESTHMGLDTRSEKSRNAQEMTATTKAPNLKLIPEITAPKNREARGFPFLSRLKKKPGDITPFVMQDPHSFVSEQYRTLRSRILSFSKENDLRTILITSCLPGEGKSTVSSNLSICIANGKDEHALLVDCDLRKPSIHKNFGLNNNQGLSNYLNQDIHLSQALYKTEIGKLTLLPAGTHPDNPSELISSEQMRNLLQEMKTRYSNRYIIIDSTPANQTPEPAILAEQVDGVILVVKAGMAGRELIARTVKQLGKEKILGVVFNMVQEPIKSRYNYNYYYSGKK
jgi:exopolysaccharide/PEP-CTERM locus tyrosine autokinase